VHTSNTRQSAHGSAILGMRRDRRGGSTGEWAPHGALRRGIVHLGYTLLSACALLCLPAAAAADEGPDHFIAVAAVGSAVRVDEVWDGAWGGEVGIGQMRPGPALAAWAGSVGLVGFSGRSGGRLWAELTVGTRWPTGALVGLGAGPAIELDQVRQPRYGGQVTVWAFAGVVPYARVGGLEPGGLFVDLGVRIAFPAIRW
jgi:hypothetical protein